MFAALLGGIAVNCFWLIDWVKLWWIRVPFHLGDSLLPHRTFHTIWKAPLWGDAVDRVLGVVLMAAGLVGVYVLNRSRQRAAARILALGAGSLLLLAILGISSESLGRLGTAHLVVPALWFAAVPAAHGLVSSLAWVCRKCGSPWPAVALVLSMLVTVGITLPHYLASLALRSSRMTPLEIGIGTERTELVDLLTRRTGPEARILWEDVPGERWTCLLPLMTGRTFLGGLDPDAGIEHSHASLVEQKLAGRHISRWTDSKLEAFCRRYNVGWFVCWSNAVRVRLSTWKQAAPPLPLNRRRTVWLYPILRPPSFTLEGQAKLIHADCRHITLANVVPDPGGKVLISFHYQAGMKTSPERVQIERGYDPDDPIAFIQLRVSGPVTRVTLTWER
jgi:hypothetical protein